MNCESPKPDVVKSKNENIGNEYSIKKKLSRDCIG